ncbi:MAG: hypothetical protein WAW11_00190 [Patescibacteria group bacterium]
MTSENIKELEFHVSSNDYFGTLATILILLQENIKYKNIKNSVIIEQKIKELIYLQNNYIIFKK